MAKNRNRERPPLLHLHRPPVLLLVLAGLALGACGTGGVSHLNEGIKYQDRGEIQQAIREYRQAIEHSPNDPTPRFNLAVLYQDEGRLDEARQEYRILLEDHPNFAPAWVNLASIDERQGDLRAAQSALERAMQMDPDSALPACQKGFFFVRTGQMEKAEEAFREGLRRDPQWANAHYGLGLVAQARGDLSKAIEHYQGAIEYNPRDLKAYLRAAELLIHEHRQDLAIRYLRRAAILDPHRGETFFQLGGLLKERGDWRDAMEAFEKALALGSHPARCHLALSEIFERLAAQEHQSYERAMEEESISPSSSEQNGQGTR